MKFLFLMASSSTSSHLFCIFLMILVLSTSTICSQELEEEEYLLMLKQVGPRRVGGRTEVRDVEKNMEVQELGHFAVKEFNRRRRTCDHEMLLFSRVVHAQRQVVSGIKYYLTVVVKVQAAAGKDCDDHDDDDGENGGEKVFEAVVVLKPWLHDYKQLLSFKPSQVR